MFYFVLTSHFFHIHIKQWPTTKDLNKKDCWCSQDKPATRTMNLALDIKVPKDQESLDFDVPLSQVCYVRCLEQGEQGEQGVNATAIGSDGVSP